jgi:hypothetical protein
VRASVLDIFCFCEPSKKQCIYLAILPTNVVKPYRIPGEQDDSLPEQRERESYSYFFLDRSGRQVTDCYDFARSFSNGVAPVKKQHKWGVIGQDGRLTSPLLLDDIQPFHNGLAVAKQRGKYGFVESSGKWRVLPQFSLAKRFSEDRAAVRLDDFRWLYIDRDGKFIIPASFNNAEPFSEGSAQASGIDWAEWRNLGCSAQPKFSSSPTHQPAEDPDKRAEGRAIHCRWVFSSTRIPGQIHPQVSERPARRSGDEVPPLHQ